MNPNDLRQKDNPLVVPVNRVFWHAEGNSTSRKQCTLLVNIEQDQQNSKTEIKILLFVSYLSAWTGRTNSFWPATHNES